MALVAQPKIVAIILPEHLLCTCLSVNSLSRHNHPARWVGLLIPTLQVGKLKHQDVKRFISWPWTDPDLTTPTAIE